jgi:hypothetical protein
MRGVSDDKPAHVLEIPDSLGRDVDKARAGKLKQALPVEAFLSDAALEQQAAATRAAMAPVHAADLQMISKAEADRRVTFDGEHLPRAPAIRRVIPEPFQRPRFDLDRHGRRWTTCPAEAVCTGDMVADVGRIAREPEFDIRYETVAGIPDVATGMKVILTGIAGNRAVFEPGTHVRAFRLAELWAGEARGPGCGSWTSAAGRASPPTATRCTSTSPASTATRRWPGTTRTSSSSGTR